MASSTILVMVLPDFSDSASSLFATSRESLKFFRIFLGFTPRDLPVTTYKDKEKMFTRKDVYV